MYQTHTKVIEENICIVCNKQFERYIGINKGKRKRKYCSNKCKRIEKAIKYESYNKIIGEKVCITCGKTFKIRTGQETKKYCSGKCKPIHRKSKINNCLVCNEQLVRHQKKLCGSHQCYEEWAKILSKKEKVIRDTKNKPVTINDMPINLQTFKKFFNKLKGIETKEVIPEIEKNEEVLLPTIKELSPKEKVKKLKFYMKNIERYKEGSIVCKYCDYIVPKKELHKRYITNKHIQYYCPCSRRVKVD